MMEQLSQDLQKTKSGELKVRAAIIAKKDLMALLIDNCSHYLGKTDAQSKVVFDDIIGQFDSMIDQACQVIQQSVQIN